MKPMLASPGASGRGARVPNEAGWQHEIKWDGVRLLADVRGGEVTLRTRSGRDVTAGFSEFADLARIAPDGLFDGEAIAWRAGVPTFSRVVDRIHIGDGGSRQNSAERNTGAHPATFMAFDLLRLDGLDITGLPLVQRRAALESIWRQGPAQSLSTTYADGPALWAATAEHGFEGVMSKRLDSAYQPGIRSLDWLKFPHRNCDSYVVGGWRTQAGSKELGAVLVGSPAANGSGELVFRGRVGSGLAGRAGARLAEVLTPLVHEHSPFAGHIPAVDQRSTTWVQPLVVIDVASLAVVGTARLRQPSFQRLRSDLNPEQVRHGNR